MAEVQKQVNAYQIDYQCDNCESDNVIIDPTSTRVIPFDYICPSCQTKMTALERYPKIIYQ